MTRAIDPKSKADRPVRSTVKIKTFANGKAPSYGAGHLVALQVFGQQDPLVSNKHVVEGADRVDYHVPGAQRQVITSQSPAGSLAHHPDLKVDLCVAAQSSSTAQIVAAAVRLYMRLPRRAHDALRRLEAAGLEAIDAAARAAGRALLDQQYEQVVARGLREGGHEHMDLDEEALREEAASLVRKSR